MFLFLKILKYRNSYCGLIFFILSINQFLYAGSKSEAPGSIQNETILIPANRDTTVTPKSFIVLGDLQRTSFWERIIGRESNDTERKLIINEIANNDPAFVVIVGDLVFSGASESDWKDFDELIKPITEKNIPVSPVLGNHDYGGSNKSALKNFSKRFSQFKESQWYIQKFDSLALVFLNSNIDDLSSEEWEIQKEWFEANLNTLNNDTSIKGIIVFLHHPPYTNSTVTSDEEHVQKKFVPAFERSEKTIAMITGHVHSYERFFKNDKTYIVSGGGGGHRVDLKPAEDCTHKDLLNNDPDKTNKRPFNFLTISRKNETVEIVVTGLLKNSFESFELERFVLQLNTVSNQ